MSVVFRRPRCLRGWCGACRLRSASAALALAIDALCGRRWWGNSGGTGVAEAVDWCCTPRKAGRSVAGQRYGRCSLAEAPNLTVQSPVQKPQFLGSVFVLVQL